MSHVNMLPSKPDVTNRLSLVEYSIFFTQFMWPCRLRTFVDRFRLSHSATVESSEHVANIVFVKNLLCSGPTQENAYILFKCMLTANENDNVHSLDAVDRVLVRIFHSLYLLVRNRIEQNHCLLLAGGYHKAATIVGAKRNYLSLKTQRAEWAPACNCDRYPSGENSKL